VTVLQASCQVCRKTAPRGLHIAHGPGCTLRSTDANCLEEGLARPCRFAGTCHDERRRVAVSAGLRGEACWFFQKLVETVGADPAERAAIQGESP
jgi:hypothetical protein